MIIVFVFDQYDDNNNGTTVSMRRFVEQLRLLGNEVRVLSTGKEEQFKYNCPVWKAKFGLKWAERIITSQGMVFGYGKEDIVRQAFTGADVVHFIFPLGIAIGALKVALDMKIPFTAAFHTQPENIVYTIHMEKLGFLKDYIYHMFYRRFYKHSHFIHCPTEFIASELRRTGYKDCDLRVISNGVHPIFVPTKVERFPESANKKIVLSIGRYSREKRHDVAIRACAQSKYAKDIVLILAGKGVMEHKHRELAAKLGVQVIWGIYTPEELVRIINMADIYVHPADAEIEAIACIEAFSCGIVTIISNHPKSATKMFALNDKCLFDHGKPECLAEKMDYWFDHPEEKGEMSKEYIEYAKNFQIRNSAKKMEQMFQDAIVYYHNLYATN